MTNKFDLTGKVALITGAAGLLGVKHAEALLSIGADVILTDVDAEKLDKIGRRLKIATKSSRVLSKVMDVSKESEILKLSRELQQDGVRVDILINNAAIDPKVKEEKNIKEMTRLENFSVDQWNLEIDVGLTGAFLCAKVFGTLMSKDEKGGVIVNIASDLSIIAPDQRLYLKKGLSEDEQPVKPITYSVIKAGMIGLTRYLATYWINKGVRCNALSPGGVLNNQDEMFVKKVSALIPMGRMANYDEYQSSIQFLCSDASSYMNGQNLVIDGGRSIL
jgi:NAD(P)-dependent dehydrogenase (short-subunit alcohol dehydrogenase family)